MPMSKDQVEFTLAVNGKDALKLRKPFATAFGHPMPTTGRRRPDATSTTEFIRVRCRPSQFTRFLIWRNEAGCQNGFKELEARLFTPPEDVPTYLDVSRNPAT